MGHKQFDQMVTPLSLVDYYVGFLGLFSTNLFCGGWWGETSFLRKFVVGKSAFMFTICRSLQSYHFKKSHYFSDPW